MNPYWYINWASYPLMFTCVADMIKVAPRIYSLYFYFQKNLFYFNLISFFFFLGTSLTSIKRVYAKVSKLQTKILKKKKKKDQSRIWWFVFSLALSSQFCWEKWVAIILHQLGQNPIDQHHQRSLFLLPSILLWIGGSILMPQSKPSNW